MAKPDAGKWGSGKVCVEGDRVNVGGINPWDAKWTRLDEPAVELPHPAYSNQKHTYWLYRAEVDGTEVVFAAGELSMNVWGFYERLA